MKGSLYIISCLLLLSFSSISTADEIVRLQAIEENAKHPKGVNLKLMSEDPDYGYTDQKPIRVGSKEEFGGPQAGRDYLKSLLDSKGLPVSFSRLGSGGNDPEGHVLDCYEVKTSDGTVVQLWISMYHPKNAPKKQPAPVGFYKKK